jgi:glycosyltransferase involved in cell wall biosynthesis
MSVAIQKPLVSVVMPIKGCNPLFLEKSIVSVLNQTLKDLELLLIVDAVGQSLEEDSVLSVLEKFKNDERMRIVVNKNSGFVEALNTGLRAARGKYVARLDGDDICLPHRLKSQIKTIEKEKLDFIGGWAYVIDEDDKTVGELTPPTNARLIKRVIMLHNPFLHSSVTFKKSILRGSGLYNQALFGAEDYDLWLRLVSLGYKCANLPSHVILLRETNNSVLRGKKWKKTRINYAKAKALGFTKLGYTDPLSMIFCLAGPLAILVRPRMVMDLKFLFRWVRKT